MPNMSLTIKYGCKLRKMAVYATALYRHGDRIDRPRNQRNSTSIHRIEATQALIRLINSDTNDTIRHTSFTHSNGIDHRYLHNHNGITNNRISCGHYRTHDLN